MDILLSTGLIILSIVFTFSFYNKLRLATREFENSKDLVKAITMTAKFNIDKQKKQIEEIEYELENIQSQIEQNRGNLENNHEQIDIILNSIMTILKMNKKISENMILLNKKINNMPLTRQDLNKHIRNVKEENAEDRSQQNSDY